MRTIAIVWRVLVLTLFASGCAWQRVDEPPAYKAEKFPITVALIPSDSPYAQGLAPDLAREMEAIGAFEQVTYPYRSGDEVDCLLEFDAVGSTDGHGVGAGIASGLTFGLAGTVVGPSVVLTHDIDFYLTNGKTEVAHDKVHVESEAEFGVFADTDEVAAKQAALHNRRIAIGILEKFAPQRSTIDAVCTGYAQQAQN